MAQTTESKIDKLNKSLKTIAEKFEVLAKSGIDEEIFEIYIKEKTKLSKKKIKEVIHHTEEFFKKICKDYTWEKL